jgi:RNA polymerase sigma-70 factor, ECF subfamily
MSIFNDNLKEIYPDIMRVAMKLSRYDRERAEDLVQKTLLKALVKQELFKGGNLVGWIVTIMKNVFRDELRKMQNLEIIDIDAPEMPQGDIGVIENPDGKGDDDGKEIDIGVRVKQVKKILKTMSGNCQSILTLIGEEYKYKEISERLNMPIGTVMSNLLRCRKKLNQKLYGMSKYNEI